MANQRDHGGNLDAAMALYGGARDEWLDLSTGINPEPYPVPAITAEAWSALPRKTDMARLTDAARTAYDADTQIIPFAGAQGAIQAVPWLTTPGKARILSPTYNEHAAALRTGGWTVEEVSDTNALNGADLAVVVNPNNPDGRRVSDLATLDVGLLVIDESFIDPEPELSTFAGDHIITLRSFGKFYGLAGLRLGFALATGPHAEKLAEIAGPWPISGPAIEIASQALTDRQWQTQTITRLTADATRLDELATRAGWSLVGGTPLFRTYDTGDATKAQAHLAQHHIWSRIFPYSDTWLRLGLPQSDRWAQLERALP